MKTSLIALFLCALVSTAAAAERPPNLVVILTDDQGYQDVGFNGCTDIPTPNIDRIAKGGVRCTSGYVTYAVCGPSRAGLITGRYQDRFGASRNPTVNPAVPNNGVPVSEKNIAELLKPAGYTSMAVGKWHLGTHPDLHPRVRGFDEFFGFLTGGHDYRPEALVLEDLSEVTSQWGWYRTKLLHNGQRITIDDYLTDELSDAGVEFIERHTDKPFFLYLAYNAPHTPMQATPKYLDRFPDIQNERRRTYAAMVSAVDDGVGRVLDALARHNLDEHTLVFFLSDNGGAHNNASVNHPLRGGKGDAFEGGVRVPFAVRWTGTLPAGIDYHHAVSALDIAATIVAHAGADVPADKPLDGVDLVPFLTGRNAAAPHAVLYWHFWDQQRSAVRMGDRKLILPGPWEQSPNYAHKMLFDLADDVGETNNRFASEPAIASDIQARLDTWKEGLVAPIAPGLGSWTFDEQ